MRPRTEVRDTVHYSVPFPKFLIFSIYSLSLSLSPTHGHNTNKTINFRNVEIKEQNENKKQNGSLQKAKAKPPL